MLTANVGKIKKDVLLNITFILNVLSENGIVFCLEGLIFKIKKQCLFQKNVFLLKQGCLCMCKYAQVYYVKSVCCMVQYIHIVIQSYFFLIFFNTLKVKIQSQNSTICKLDSIFTFLGRAL